MLLDLAEHTREGEPRLALVTGEAGIGKTRLPLERLATDDVRRQRAGLIDEPLPPEVVRNIIDTGDGVAFVVEELVAAGGRPGLSTVSAVAEREVLALLAEGRTNEQIATELFMSPKTASVHVSRILTKLGVGNRTEAAAVARRIGLL